MFTLNDHAVPLRTDDNGAQIKALGVHVKAEEIGDRTIRMIASTEGTDRVGDVIRADGWMLDWYKRNPVVLWQHDYDVPAIAMAKATWVEDKKLMQDWYFSPEYGKANPLSESIYVGYKENVFQSSSVGFKPLVSRALVVEDEEGNKEETGGFEFIKQELYEVSAVNVPANPEAIQVLRSKGIDTRPLEEMMVHAEGLVINLEGELETENTESEVETEGECEGEDFTYTVTGDSEETVVEQVIEDLEGRGFVIFCPDSEPKVDKEIEIEEEPIIKLQPEPSDEIAVTEAQLAALKSEVLEQFASLKRAHEFTESLKREINYRYGIISKE